MSKCECGGCGLKFSCTSAFQLHRVGKYEDKGRRCVPGGEQLVARGLVLVKGIWKFPRTQRLDLYRIENKIGVSGDIAG